MTSLVRNLPHVIISLKEKCKQGPNLVGMLVSEAYETGGCATRMGSFAAFVTVQCKTTVIHYQCWQRNGLADSKNFLSIFFFQLNGAQQSESPQRWPCIACAQAERLCGGGWVQGGSAGPPSIRGDSFWEMSFTNISFSLHKQKHNNTRRVAVVS